MGQEIVNKMLSLKLAQPTDYEHQIFDYNGDQKVDLLVSYRLLTDSYKLQLDFFKLNGSFYP